MGHANVDRLMAEIEEVERRHDAAAFAEWQRMRQQARRPVPRLKPMHLFIGIVLTGGAILYLVAWWLNGWHF
jgi:hypothetical protein